MKVALKGDMRPMRVWIVMMNRTLLGLLAAGAAMMLLVACGDPDGAAQAKYNESIALQREGRIDEAIAIYKRIVEKYPQTEIASHVNEQLFFLGFSCLVAIPACVMDEALEVADGIDNAISRSWALRRIAAGQAEMGHFDEAMVTVSRIEEDRVRAQAVVDIAGVAADAGHFDLALEVTNRIDGLNIELARRQSFRSQALHKIAAEKARAGRSEEALANAREIVDSNLRVSALVKIAEARRFPRLFSGEKLFAEATEEARLIGNAENRAKALLEIAAAKDDSEILAAALVSARRIPVRSGQEVQGLSRRAFMIRKIAATSADLELFEEAKKWARQIEDEDRRRLAIREIAIGKIEAGYLNEALVTASELKGTGYRAGVLYSAALEQSRAGQFEKAVSTSRMMVEGRDQGWRAMSLRDIAHEQAKQGLIDEALYTAREIDVAVYRAGAIIEIAAVQYDPKLLTEALNITREEVRESGRPARLGRDGLLMRIAQEQARAGFGNEARTIAREIENVSLRVEALRDIAVALPK